MPIVLPLVALDVLVIALWVIAAALAIALIMRKVGGVFQGIPVVGGYIAGAVGSVASAISSACGALIRGIDSAMGAAWHLLARYLDTLWHQIESQAHLAAYIAQIIGGQLAHVTGLSSLVHRLEQAWHGIEQGVKTLTREYHGIDRRVSKLEHDLARGIGNDVRGQVRALEREVATVENKTIPAIRGIADDAVTEVSALQKWIAANIPAVGTTEFVSAIAAALGALGLGWLRCNSNPFTRNPAACGLLSDLARFLPFLGLLAIAFDFEEFTDAAIVVADGIGSVVAGIEGSFETALPPLPPPN